MGVPYQWHLPAIAVVLHCVASDQHYIEKVYGVPTVEKSRALIFIVGSHYAHKMLVGVCLILLICSMKTYSS